MALFGFCELRYRIGWESASQIDDLMDAVRRYLRVSESGDKAVIMVFKHKCWFTRLHFTEEF